MSGNITGRLLRASKQGISTVNSRLEETASTLEALATELKISQELIGKFLRGEEVDQQIPLAVCKKLGLDWKKIIDVQHFKLTSAVKTSAQNGISSAVRSSNAAEIAPKSQPISAIDVSSLIQTVKTRLTKSIELRCGFLRVLDMPKAVSLLDIYTDAYFLTHSYEYSRLTINDLYKNFEQEGSSDFGFLQDQREVILGKEIVEQNSKLILSGKLGSGKTVFLKYVALQCMTGELLGDRIPIYIQLNDFAEVSFQSNFSSMEAYLKQYLSASKFTDVSAIQHLLEKGKFLILLDGFDAIAQNHIRRVIREIRNFSEQFNLNHFAIASRVTNRLATLEQFVEFEIADFDSAQVSAFAHKWFKTTSPEIVDLFLTALKSDLGLKQLSGNPLLLTLMSSVFAAQKNLDFIPLHDQISDLLFSNWNAQQLTNSERSTPNLSIRCQRDILGAIALNGLKRDEYFFRKASLRQIIQQYMDEWDSLTLNASDPELIIDSLEVNHGILVKRSQDIYSFSQVISQEYWAANKIITTNSVDGVMDDLLEGMLEKKWQNVIISAVTMLPNADQFLLTMKNKIDHLIADDQHLQEFLEWVGERAQNLHSPYKAVTIRAYYLDIELENVRVLDRARALDLAHTRTVERARMRATGYQDEMNTEIDIDQTLTVALNLDLALFFVSNPILVLARNLDPKVDEAIRNLSKQIPSPKDDIAKFHRWWQAKGMDWSKKLRSVIIQSRKSIHEWEFSEEQKQLLNHYHDANLLLVKCLNNADRMSKNVSEKVKNDIESSLFVAISSEL